MFSTVLSATLHGLCVEFVNVETDLSNGLPMFHMVGYLSSEVKEAGERVRTAIRNSDIVLPAKKIVVNLSPADVRKRGTAFDLPIAVSILAALGMINQNMLECMLFIGELSLDGSVRGIPGVLPIVSEARERGVKYCIVPDENVFEGCLVDGIQIVGVRTLKDVCDFLKNPEKCVQRNVDISERKESQVYELDYKDIRGQRLAKRAAEVAVAGNHNLLLIGPPGSGKTMIAKRIPTILPPLTREESLELTKLYSIMGELDGEHPLIQRRPFREVHHTVTKSALLGGGVIPVPGEISLSDKGVLFLDEIAEFQKSTLEMLRKPLEEHSIKILRNRGEYKYPADFLLVAAMNPCPCGNYPDLNRCICTTPQIQAYLGKLSQPLLDRIDMCVEAERVEYEMLQEEGEESSATIRERVVRAREIQKERYREIGILTNSQLSANQVKEYCSLGREEETMMHQAFDRFHLTVRVYHKILCVARTIADLDGEETISTLHLREAIGYRSPNKKYWGR